ncbi:MAG: GNAT family N-acetyltransferase [Gemmatimonadaceae bacterium]
MSLRPLSDRDATSVRRLVAAEVGGTPYGGPLLPVLDLALESDSREARGMVAESPDGVVGLVLYGLVAGARGAGRIHLIVVTAAARLNGVGSSLVDAAAEELRAWGARFVVAELADDPVLAPGRTLLDRTGFAEEARVGDYYRDGVALTLMRREL